jgi:hypothetical protein
LLRNLLGIKKKFTEEGLENKSLVTLLREGMEDAGYDVTINVCGKKVYPKPLKEQVSK